MNEAIFDIFWNLLCQLEGIYFSSVLYLLFKSVHNEYQTNIMPDSVCFNWIQSYPIDTWLPGATGKIGVGGILLFFLYISSASMTLVWVHFQRIRAALGDLNATKYVIFPIYIPYMWASAFSDFLMALLLAAGSMSGNVQVNIEDPNTIAASAGIGVIFGFQHFVIEGIAFILLQFGCGYQSRKTAAKWSFAWGCITAFVQFCQFRYGTNKFSSVFLNAVWNFALIVFYGSLWIIPMKSLFRRPALLHYSRFWCLYRILVFVASTLVVYTNNDDSETSYSVGFRDFCGCLYIAGALILFALCKPYVIYSALLWDSQWWQGISMANSTDEVAEEMDYYITTPTATPTPTKHDDHDLDHDNENGVEGDDTAKWSIHSFNGINTYRKVNSPGPDSHDMDVESRGSGGSNGSNKRESSRSREGSVAKSSKNAVTSNLQNPLAGIEVGYSEARNLAQQVATLRDQGNVKLLNFAYILLDRTAPLLGSGSFSKVFRGTYRRAPVAIKLLFTPDLNPQVIRRCASEASILSQISRLDHNKYHANVVRIFGVSVLPPSVCIVLEICYYGSLSDVIRGVNYFKPTTRESYTSRNSFTNRESFGSNQSGSALSLALEINPSTGSAGDLGVRAPMNLTLSDKYFLALGCARGLEALHTYKNNALGLCHRDVKSFNFLVDAQLNAKISDMELSTTEISRSQPPKPVDKCEHADSFGSSSGTGSNDQGFEDDMYSSLLPRESESASMSITEQLPVWLAPEVINPSGRNSPAPSATHASTNARYSQASDIYALGLVLWEIMSMKIPYFDECGDSDEAIRNHVLRGLRPKFNTFCRTNTHEMDTIPQPFSANCNGNGYNTLDSSYVALTTDCWRQDPAKRPKISEIVFRLEEFCWNKTLYSYIRETEHVLDHSIVINEYRAKCRATEKKHFFSSNFLGGGNGTSGSNGNNSGDATHQEEETNSTRSVIATPNVDMDKPPSSAFISSLLNTLKLEPNWMKLDYCTQQEHAHHGGGYVVLAATPVSPYLIVWCTKFFLSNTSMPLNNCGLTMNDLLALELTYVLYELNAKRHPYKVQRGSGKNTLTKVAVANYKVLLNKCIAETIGTGRPTHCVLCCHKQESIYPMSQHNPSPGQGRAVTPPPGAGLHGSAVDDTLVNYSVHVFPVFTKETSPPAMTTEEEEVASVYDSAVDVTHRPVCSSSSATVTAAPPSEGTEAESVGTPIPITIPIPITAEEGRNQSEEDDSTLSREQSTASVSSSVSNRLRQISTSLFCSSPGTSTVDNTGANSSLRNTINSICTSTHTPDPSAADKHPTVAYVVVQFSNLNLPALPR